MLDFVHGLADADCGGHMEYDLSPLERAAHRRSILYVAPHQLGFGREIDGHSVRMDLLGEIVKDADVVSALQQSIAQVRSHEPCSTGDEYVFGHRYSAPIMTASLFLAVAYLRTDHTANSTKSSTRFGGLV